MKRTGIVLSAITAFAFLLRVWQLGTVPPGLGADEASIGYNAYSLLVTGRDEFGVPHPLTFRAYGEYQRPVSLYVYAAVPAIAALGPTPFAVRLPGAIAGTLSVPAMYAVAVLLLRRPSQGLFAAGLLAVSPWHLQLSRGAREASVLLLVLLVFVACLIAALRSASRSSAPAKRLPALAVLWPQGALLLAAAVAFALTLYTYPGGMVFAPLLLVVLLATYRRRIRWISRRWAALAIGLAAALCVPLAVHVVDGRARARGSEGALFTSSEVADLAASRAARDAAAGRPAIFDSPSIIGARLAVDAYLLHFNPTYLFTGGDAEWRHPASDVGQLYLWDLPLVLVGVVVLVRRRGHWDAQAIGGWLLVGPVPAAFDAHAPHAVRSIVMLPAWYLVEAAALPATWRWLRARALHRDWLVLLAASVTFYLYMYYRHYPFEHARPWSSGEAEGYRAAQAEIAAGRFDRVVVVQHSGLSLLQALYALGYDPQVYLAQGGSRPAPDGTVRFAPFELRDVEWQNEPRAAGTLYVVGGDTPLPADAQIVKPVPSAGGYTAVVLVAL